MVSEKKNHFCAKVHNKEVRFDKRKWWIYDIILARLEMALQI